MYRKTWIEIDVEALSKNIATARDLVGDEVEVLVPVKADAYGHGIVEISRHLESEGITYLGVRGHR